MDLKFKLLDTEAILPSYATSGSAGMDLYATKSYVINPHETILVDTGLSMEIPDGMWAGIFPRSGLAVKKGINLANCVAVIDSDYRGEVKVPLKNNSEESFFVSVHDRIAQMVILPYYHMNVVSCNKLDDTDRGAGGFGSTGVK